MLGDVIECHGVRHSRYADRRTALCPGTPRGRVTAGRRGFMACAPAGPGVSHAASSALRELRERRERRVRGSG